MRRRTDRRWQKWNRSLRGATIASVVMMQAVVLAGCSARAIVPNERDPLRDQIRALEAEKASLELRIDELNATLAQQAAAASLPPEVLANLPLPIRVVARFGSAVSATDEPGEPIELTVHLDPTDSRERFVQLTGWVDLTIVRFTGDPSEAIVLASATFDPSAVRDALRSGLFGTHYAFTLTLPAQPANEALPTVVARVRYRDGLADRVLESAVECPLLR
jgi:hypothetical protein